MPQGFHIRRHLFSPCDRLVLHRCDFGERD